MRKRRKKGLKGRKNYAFVVDGKTEDWYLQMLKRNEKDLTINIEPKLPSKKSLANQYDMVEALARDYTKVFWIVDYDVIRKESQESKRGAETSEQLFIKLREKANAKDNVEVIVNTPCLEFWFLLHFVNTGRFFAECSSAEKELVKHLEDYEKTQKYFTRHGHDIYLRLKGRLAEAVQRAEDLGPYDEFNTDRAVCEMGLFFCIPEIREVVFDD